MAKNNNHSIGGSRENTRQMKLVNKLDKMSWKLNMTTSYLDIYRDDLNAANERKYKELDNRISRKLKPLEYKCANESKLAEDAKARLMPEYDRKAALAFREYRQGLRRAEGVVDKEGRVIEGKSLSNESEKKLEAFKLKAEAERKAYLQNVEAQAKTKVLPEKERAGYQKQYDAAMAVKSKKLDALRANREKTAKEKYERFAAKSRRKLDRLNHELPLVQNQLNETLGSTSYGMPEDVVLRLEGLGMQFGGLKAVNDLSFDVKKGEIFGLIGPNGAGKTTVFNCITQFYKPTSGEVYYRNREGKELRLNSYRVHDVIKTGIVRTFQNVEVIYELSILQNLLIAAHSQYKSNIFAQMFNTRSVKQEEAVLNRKALDVLEYCGISHLKDYPPVGMPYGILKRIELARTLMAGANLIILDEPAAGLNDKETQELAALIRKIRDEYNVTIFLVEHDMGLVMDICDHICAISFGKKLAYGTPAEIQADPTVQEAYLGTAEKQVEAEIGGENE